jgi:hypothetical protein
MRRTGIIIAVSEKPNFLSDDCELRGSFRRENFWIEWHAQKPTTPKPRLRPPADRLFRSPKPLQEQFQQRIGLADHRDSRNTLLPHQTPHTNRMPPTPQPLPGLDVSQNLVLPQLATCPQRSPSSLAKNKADSPFPPTLLMVSPPLPLPTPLVTSTPSPPTRTLRRERQSQTLVALTPPQITVP